MKKLLALFLALMLAFSVSACSLFGGDKEDSKKSAKTDKAAVEETVNAFMGAFVDFKFDELKNYVVDEKSIPKDLVNFDFDDYFDDALNDLPSELDPYTSDFKDLFDTVIDKLKSDFTYEITSVEKIEKEDKYNVTVEVTMPDVENFDFESIMSEDDFTAAVSDLISTGKLTPDMSETEMMDLVVETIIDTATDAVNNTDFKTTTDEMVFDVVKTDDGEWLIELESDDISVFKFSNLKPSIGNF